MDLKNYPVGRKNDIVVQELDGEVLIYDLKINKALCLNQTAALVWRFSNGVNSITEISLIITRELGSKVDAGLVVLALERLQSEGLLENRDQFRINVPGMSRRDVIRKAAFASLVALPVILTIHAPVAAAAFSVCNGATCTCPTISGPTTPDRIGEVCVVDAPECPPGCEVCRHSGPLGTTQGTCYPIM